MAAHQAPPSLGFSRQEHWIGLPFPSPVHESEKWKWSHSVVSDSSQPHGLQPTRLLRPWDFPDKNTGVGCHCLLPSLCYNFQIRNRVELDPSVWRSLGVYQRENHEFRQEHTSASMASVRMGKPAWECPAPHQGLPAHLEPSLHRYCPVVPGNREKWVDGSTGEMIE